MRRTAPGGRAELTLAEQGRRLASQRDDLIAAGVDPAQLEIPLHPVDPHADESTDVGGWEDH